MPYQPDSAPQPDSPSATNYTESQGDRQILQPPKGKERLAWLGPSFLWMLSAAGSGELLFTPRVAAQYGYTLLWALLAAVILKWFINREVGRFTVCTGATVLQGFGQLPGSKNWAVWLILIPQAFVAVSTVAGLTGAAATALILLTGGTVKLWMPIITIVTAAIIFLGQYKVIDKLASYLGIALFLAIFATAISVSPNLGEAAAGLVPQLPDQVNYQEILPWLGLMLAGAAGMMWYSYWIQARGYGAANLKPQAPLQPRQMSQEERDRLRGWLKHMTLANTVAVVGALLIAIAFLVLGTELLKPEGLVPEQDQIAETLGKLLGNVWGAFSFWFMIVAVFVTFCSTTLSDQDGFARMFADGTRLLLQGLGIQGRWMQEKRLQQFYIILLLAVLPIVVYLIFGEPVGLLQTAGVIEAAHIPIVTGLVLYLNHHFLPDELRASKLTVGATAIAGLFFAVFALVYLYQLMEQS